MSWRTLTAHSFFFLFDRSRSSSSSPPPSERTPRLCRPRERVVTRDKTAVVTERSAATLSCCTPTPTPTPTPLQTPSNTPTSSSPKGVRGDSGLPPVPPFPSRFSPPRANAKATSAAGCGASGAKKGGRGTPRMFDDRAGPFAGQGAPFSGGAVGGEGVAGGRRWGSLVGVASRQPEQGRVQREKTPRVVPSVESEVRGNYCGRARSLKSLSFRLWSRSNKIDHWQQAATVQVRGVGGKTEKVSYAVQVVKGHPHKAGLFCLKLLSVSPLAVLHKRSAVSYWRRSPVAAIFPSTG